MSIPDIGLGADSIPSIGIWVQPPSQALLVPRLPHGVSMELPLINMPGCVEAHVDSDLQTGLTTSDPDRVAIYCDSGMPSFSAMSYEPNKSNPVSADSLPKLGNSNADEAGETPSLPIPTQPIHTANTTSEKKSSKPQCKDGELLKDGECVAVETQAEIAVPEFVLKHLPPLEAVTNTATIATVATVSALLAKPVADFLLKLIKPMIKKIITKIKKAMGKKVPLRSVAQRRIAQRSKHRVLRQARDLMG